MEYDLGVSKQYSDLVSLENWPVSNIAEYSKVEWWHRGASTLMLTSKRTENNSTLHQPKQFPPYSSY